MENETLYVCLGNWMDETAQLNEESKQRVELLIELVRQESGHVLFTGWPYRPDCSTSIAKAMSDYFHMCFPKRSGVFFDEVARDTVGDAICVRLWCERRRPYRLVHIVTSNYHVPRTQEIFKFVFSTDVAIKVSGAGKKSPADAPQEYNSLLAFRETFKDVSAGDMPLILERLLSVHPYYNGKVYPAMRYDALSNALVPIEDKGTVK
ncbi:MAG: YdcF family protein [Rhodobacteraceae bacterium]|nr:YdcF family protein [Paracoccaceae bacterium]